MKFPLIVISYGAFGADQKVLFSYEDDGVPMFPVFNDLVVASQFCIGMQNIISERGDDRHLSTQVCSKPEHAKDMFTVITSIAPDIATVIFDPSPPQGLNEDAIKNEVVAKNRMVPIETVIEELHDM